MITFKEYVAEAMNPTKQDFNKDAKHDGSMYSVFTKVDGTKYRIDFRRTEISKRMKDDLGITKNAWMVQFAVSKSKIMVALDKVGPDFEMQNKNKGTEFKLLPIVLGYILSFIEQKKPDAIKLLADKKEDSRVRVYERILDREKANLEKIGYTSLVGKNGGSHEAFVIYKSSLKP